MSDAASCTATRWLSIVGIGEDGIDGLSPVARKLLASAELVVGGKRHLGLAKALIRGRTLAWPSPIGDAVPEIEKHRGRPVVVLASGDPFHYGVGDLLLRSIPANETLCLPNASAFSLAAARLGWSLQEVALVSLHGRALEGIVRHLQPGARILALSWDGATPAKLAEFLVERGMGRSTLTVIEAMGGPRERVRSATAAGFDIRDVAPLNTIALQVAAAADATVLPLAPGLDDTLFDHDGQLTKREVRAITVSALATRRPPGFNAVHAASIRPGLDSPPPRNTASGDGKSANASGARCWTICRSGVPNTAALRAARAARAGSDSMPIALSDG